MITDFRSLPKTFAPQKPHQTVPSSFTHDFLIHRKRDGQRHYVLWTPRGEVRLYTRSMIDKTEFMPLTVRALADLDMPPRTLLDGELIVDQHGHDDLRATNEVCRSGAGVARFNERKLPLKFMPFDMLFHNGHDLWKEPYEVRWEFVTTSVVDGVRITFPETFEDFAKAQRYVQRRGWEGLILWDRSAPHKMRLDGGTPYRHGCYKWKPITEGDFVAVGWEPGKGKHAGRMGALRIAEFQRGMLVEIGTVGTGFDDAMRTAAMRWKYPLVVQLKYLLQQEDTRALREPVFVRVHPDKKVRELR